MRSIRRYIGTELQRPRILLIKILFVALLIFFVLLWHEHQALSAATISPSSPPLLPSTKPTINKGGTPDVSIIVLAQSKHLVHTRNCLRAVHQHISQNSEFTSVASYEIMVMEIGYEYHRRNGLRKATSSLCPECVLHLTNDTKNENHQPLVKAINSGAAAAKGSFLFFLTDSTELSSSSSLPSLLSSFIPVPSLSLSPSPHVGIVGSKLLAPDHTIVHGGIEFIMTRKSKFGAFYNKNFPSPVKKFAGYPKTHPRSLVRADVDAVLADMMMTRAQVFRDLGGFKEVYGDQLAYVDFCLRAKLAGHHVVYSPQSVGVHFEGEEGETEDDAMNSWGSDSEILAFSDEWSNVIGEKIESTYQIHNLTLRWNMECGAGQTLGFTTEAIYFMLGLEGKVDLKIEINNAVSCKTELQKAGLPKWVVRSVMRLASKYVSPTNKNILVIHRDPGRYNYFITHSDDPIHYIIGRSMYETDRIPADWVKPCNESVKEIWVPSHFNKETFTRSGVDSTKLYVVPEPIDVVTYDPDVTEPLLLKDKKSFSFLAVMKWEKRKGWDILLRAYLTEFSATDDVSLFIRANLDAKNRKEFEDFVKNTTERLLLENPKKTFPQLPQTEDALLPYLGMPSLYKSVDCLVLSSHGEGWGLPIIEAMSMGLPTIATNWSGNTEFMTSQNSYLIEVEGFVNATVQDHKWAQPKETHLRTLMRRVYSNPEEGKRKGAIAKENVKQFFSTDKVGDIVIKQLRRIKAKLDAEPPQTPQLPGSVPNSPNSQNSPHSPQSPNAFNSNNVNPPPDSNPATPVERVKTKMKIVAM